MDTYERITYLQVAGQKPIVLRKDYIDVDYEVNDRTSFVYTRTRRISRAVNPYVKAGSVFDKFLDEQEV